tara:strand:+ start:1989 stop:2678 length:690 start_codon:yes stop_codon:yes gene_type:complete
VHVSVIVFPGSNCDRDVKVAIGKSMGSEPEMVWHGSNSLPKTDLIILPGGFSYGDYLRSGAMAAHSPIMREVITAANSGLPVLAICNGFQIAIEAGLLPGALIRNSSLKFVCRNVFLKVENNKTIHTNMFNNNQVVRMPIAHQDGNFFIDEDGLNDIRENDQIAFSYSDQKGTAKTNNNPNGSIMNIAGIFNKEKNVLGMMPHPERVADPLLGGTDGKTMFDGLIATLN